MQDHIVGGESMPGKVIKGLRILAYRLRAQGIRVTLLWALDHAVRAVRGANIRRLSQTTPALFVGGQYRRWGWPVMTGWGITAVVNMRAEFDDQAIGIAPPRYLHLPVEDDAAPTIEQLLAGVRFIADEIARGGKVYVHCGAGVGRAATMAAAYLVSTGLTPTEAWRRLQAVRPFIKPTAVQLAQLEQFAEQWKAQMREPIQG
ncbi:MAG: protein-tyrosine phosphatase family protein [Anaerolineae bacterium]